MLHFAIDQETTGISVGLTPIKGNSVFYSRIEEGLLLCKEELKTSHADTNIHSQSGNFLPGLSHFKSSHAICFWWSMRVWFLFKYSSGLGGYTLVVLSLHLLSNSNFLEGKNPTATWACPQESGINLLALFSWGGGTVTLRSITGEARDWGESAHSCVPRRRNSLQLLIQTLLWARHSSKQVPLRKSLSRLCGPRT